MYRVEEEVIQHVSISLIFEKKISCYASDHFAVVYNNKMYIFGGYNAIRGEHFNSLYEYDPKKCTWTKTDAFGEKPCERRRQACVSVGNRVFLFGGTRYLSKLYEFLGINSIYFSPLPNFCENGQDIEDRLIDHSDMHILDFAPTLRTLCMVAIRKYGLELEDTVLPQNLK